MRRWVIYLALIFQASVCTSRALPQRLVIALDGISYRDVVALQKGVLETNLWGTVSQRQAFTAAEGYYPVSRMVSTFPSTSDVAWTDIFGNHPLPGYQRTYFSDAANAEVFVNGLTSTVEHEREMDWETDNNFIRSMGYIYSKQTFDYELSKLMESFWNRDNTNSVYYVYIRSSDDAQHMDRDILSMLAGLDATLQDLRARYKAREGHDLQILIISDHGHNHAGRGTRVEIKPFLEKNGYRITQSIQTPKDVVLPTSGIEDWIEIHNDPAINERLAERLTQLKGADVVVTKLPDQTNCYLVLNHKGERAVIRWNPEENRFKYMAENGDPLDYAPVVKSLAQKKLLEADGFASAEAWMNETMTCHYPMALQRIVRGLTCVTLNPATILVSLDNHYVNAGWLVNAGSKLESCGSTHGALDDINTLGIVLSNFEPTHDTSTEQVAGYFDNFPGLRNYHEEENGAEWVTKVELARTRIPRDPFDQNYQVLSNEGVYLRVWSPDLASAAGHPAIDAVIEKISGDGEEIARGNLQPRTSHVSQVTFSKPISFPDKCPCERIYECPVDLGLKPNSLYEISGWLRGTRKSGGLFELYFRTDTEGRPVAY